MSPSECRGLTSTNIENIIKCLKSVGLQPEDCRAQTYDGAGNMAGNQKGCASRFLKISPCAPYCHCASHELNLALSKACKIPEIHCMLCTFKSFGIFYKYSPKRQRCFEKAIDSVNEDIMSTGGETIKKIKIEATCTL